MSHGSKLRIKGQVFALSKKKYSFSKLEKRCDVRGIKMSKCNNIINWKKNQLIGSFRRKETQNEYSKKLRAV